MQAGKCIINNCRMCQWNVEQMESVRDGGLSRDRCMMAPAARLTRFQTKQK